MIPFFLLFLIPAALTFAGPPGWGKTAQGRQLSTFYAVFMALMIGFRYRVGGDWSWDNHRIINNSGRDFFDFLKISGDIGYGAILYITEISGMNVWVNHLIGGGVFAYGLRKFCLQTPYPWLAMTVAVPYLVTVVAMAYDRQAMAIGFIMLAMVALQNQSLRNFIINIILATAAHTTALVLMPVFVFASKIKKTLMIAISGPVLAAGYYLALRDRAETSIQAYVGVEMSSSGAAIRVAMSAIPAAIYFVLRKRFQFSEETRQFADVICATCLLFVVLLVVSPSSTAVDRMALYLLPVQMLIYGSLPSALSKSASQQAVAAALVLYSFLVMIVWLNFAVNAPAWLPYQIMDFDALTNVTVF